MPEQEIKEIPVRDLVLWTENPRDTISARASNVSIIRQALDDVTGRWKLRALAKEMGEIYDFSELPTVVYLEGKPVVFDGNRRVILAKLGLGIHSDALSAPFRLPSCPELLPCCVTSRKLALDSIWRKHASNGSWDQLSRDYFLYKFRGEEKSILLQLDEIFGGRLSFLKSLNSRFAREDVFIASRLRALGIKVQDGKILSRHDPETTYGLFDSLFSLIVTKKLTTRENRRRQLDDLIREKFPSFTQSLSEDAQKPYQEIASKDKNKTVVIDKLDQAKAVRLPRRVATKEDPLFGEKLDLEPGNAANLYRDILDLYDFWKKHQSNLSAQFPGLIRMALRLICDLVAREQGEKKFANLLEKDFEEFKTNLTQNQKTFIFNQKVDAGHIVPLLNCGAHDYMGNNDIQQTIAISFILGQFLLKYHARNRSE